MTYNETKRPAMVPCGDMVRDKCGEPVLNDKGELQFYATYFDVKTGDLKKNANGEPVKVYAFHHPCFVEGCNKQGIFGAHVSLKNGKPGNWYCVEHKEEWRADR